MSSQAPYMFSRNADPGADLSVDSFTAILEGRVALTRSVKDDTARRLWGLFGSQSSTYRCAGWAWPMHKALGCAGSS